VITLQRMQPWLGTFVIVRVTGDDRALLLTAMQNAFDSIARVHQLMSFHDQNSDVSRLNREALHRELTIDPWTYQVLSLATQLAQDSNGLFDITVASLLMKQGHLPNIMNGVSSGNWRDVLITNQNRVRFARPVTIDLGGIAKGFAVDQAVLALRTAGVTQGLVNAGGDLRVFGDITEQISIRHPHATHQVGHTIPLHNAALATSAPSFSTRRSQFGRTSALINPLKKSSYIKPTSVSVSAATCMVADALTKIVVLNPNNTSAILSAYQAQATVVHARTPITASTKFHAYLADQSESFSTSPYALATP
jgi:FAD:protein FMN transferase